MGKHTVTLPDGTTAKRNSKTMTYTHAVVIRTDNRALAAAKRTEARKSRELRTEAERIIATGDLTVLNRVHSSSNGLGQKFYNSVVPGDYPSQWLPDHLDTAGWDKWIAKALQQISDIADRLDREADALDAAPQFGYGVFRWSQNAVNAGKGADEYRRYAHTASTVTVVPVD